MRWARYVACIGAMQNAYRIIVGKTEGRRLRWKNNIKMEV
jgi:hypothetical protein